MRRLALIVVLTLAACDAPPPPTAFALVETPETPGLGLRELPEETLRSLELPFGLAVVKIDAAAERAGLRLGDVVYGVNQILIRSVADYTRLVSEQPGGVLGLLVRRGKSDFYVSVEPAGALRSGPGAPELRRPATDTLRRT